MSDISTNDSKTVDEEKPLLVDSPQKSSFSLWARTLSVFITVAVVAASLYCRSKLLSSHRRAAPFHEDILSLLSSGVEATYVDPGSGKTVSCCLLFF